jgi:hypothetical protein
LDTAPVWDAAEGDGYAECLFRDIIASLDVSQRKLLIAIRTEKSVTEIAKDARFSGHAAVSRKVNALKTKIRQILH